MSLFQREKKISSYLFDITAWRLNEKSRGELYHGQCRTYTAAVY